MNKFMNLSDEMIKNLEYYMPQKQVLQQLADFFGVFSDGTRLKILSALSMGRMCVNDISMALDINQTTVSHQLKLLKSMGIVKNMRLGKVIFYDLSNHIINDVLLSGVDYLEANIV
ncbi:MAG: metalloregulator ArsR/SmtB family transcription factor [Christensenellaceae bacterium]|jgi:ArsR family transcriptional regulator|nr:metalloregulator ArsR/SmtB family transcription factor [Christensenellaceae bacterium]